MPLFAPRLMLDKMICITPELLRERGLSVLLLDIDNTMTTHDNPVPAEGVTEWIKQMQSEGFRLIVVSNNSEERVKPFAQLIGLDFVSHGCKPLPSGFRRACEQLGVKPSQAAVVGDQIFTDILGGNLLGAYTILTVPYQLEEMRFFKLKRALEKPIIRSYLRRARRRSGAK